MRFMVSLINDGTSMERATPEQMREEGKPVVTDGPFAESKEQMAGYMVLECEDLDAAIGWAEKLPVRRSSVEVRAISEGTTEEDV